LLPPEQRPQAAYKDHGDYNYNGNDNDNDMGKDE
jgi:hypothetical protein